MFSKSEEVGAGSLVWSTILGAATVTSLFVLALVQNDGYSIVDCCYSGKTLAIKV